MVQARRSPYNPRYVKDPEPIARACEHPECDLPATHRAPRSPRELNSYRWFCLDHVRAYNQAWNYYAGMTPGEIEAHIRFDTIWQRPTWRFGTNVGGFRPSLAEEFARAYEELTGDKQYRFRGEEDAKERFAEPQGEEARAMATLELEPPLTKASLKARYKALVKRYHPDANGGDKASEDMLKAINQAYATLKNAVRA